MPYTTDKNAVGDRAAVLPQNSDSGIGRPPGDNVRGRTICNATLGQRGRAAAGFFAVRGRFGISSWLLLVVYPLSIPLDQVPVLIGERTYSVGFFVAVVCAVIVILQVVGNQMRVQLCNRCFLLGLAVWLAANVGSLLINSSLAESSLVISLATKAAFAFLFYLALVNGGGLKIMLNCYIAGCGVAGLWTISYALAAGDLNAVREAASFVQFDSSAFEVDLLTGLAAAGAGKLLPLWLCVFLYTRQSRIWLRSVYLTLVPYFAVLALMSLRREVMVEMCLIIPILLFAVPRRGRFVMGLVAVVAICSIAGFIGVSERWQDRLFVETRDRFETESDYRTVLLINTPKEFTAAPLLGQGPGSYRWTMDKYFSADDAVIEREGAPAHNSFSAAAVETGILGLLGLITMVAGLGWRACSLRSWHSREYNPARLLSLMIFLHFLVLLNFGEALGANPTWFFVGILLYLDRWMALENKTPVLQLED